MEKQNIAITIDTAQFDKSIKEIDKKIIELTKSRKIIIAKPKTKETEDAVKKIESRLTQLSNQKIEIETNIAEIENEGTLALDSLANKNTTTTKIFSEQWKKSTDETQQIFDSFLQQAGDLGDAIVNAQNNKIDGQLQSTESAYKTEIELLEKKYEQEQESYKNHLENIDEQRAEHEEKLNEANIEREELEAEKETIMVEDDYLALQEKIKNKENEIAAQEALINQINEVEKNTLLSKEISEKEYQARKEEREHQYLIKKAELERKQAIANKGMQIFNASMNMASAIMGVTAGSSLLPWMIPIQIAMVSAIGVAQIAAIMNAPLPEIPSFAMGGMVPRANNYLYPGIPQAKDERDKTLIWARQGEMVLTPTQALGYRDFQMWQNQSSINNMTTSNNLNNSSVNNNYEIALNIASNKSNPHEIAKAVVKAIGH